MAASDLSIPPVKAFALHVYARSVHPELFDPHESIHFSNPSCKGVASLGPYHHIVTLHIGAHTLTEVVAHDTMALPSHREILSERFGRETTFRRTTVGDVSYLTNTQRETVSESIYRQIHRDLRAMTTRRGLYLQPKGFHRALSAPFGAMRIALEAHALHVTTFHGLGDQFTLLKTQSIFDLTS
ncbi:MAG: hypothetical protein HN909_05900 [Phycisphaerales bacterium]|jgi:hypothetical protein|nr:hypothetical protein [Phycisphaerales bacterium]MBT7171287.1 hypothetical protein [Phycisphaerales bacterium]